MQLQSTPADIVHPSKNRSLSQRIRERLKRSLDWRLLRWMLLGDAQQAWYLRRILPLLEIDLVVDVGGNLGQYATLLRGRAGWRGPILSVEPVPALAARFAQRFRWDRQWALVTCALGEQAERRMMHVMRGHELSSLLKPDNSVTDQLDRFNHIERQYEVEVRTLDELLHTHPMARGAKSIYLKLDVQGAELQILRGAPRTLPRIAALQAEASVIPLYTGIAPYYELMREIEAMGFQLSFLPAHNYTQVPDMIDFDCHFVNRRRLVSLGYLRAPTTLA